jgi:hypothetical protein
MARRTQRKCQAHVDTKDIPAAILSNISTSLGIVNTDYKVQGATYDSIIVDLHRRDNGKGSVSHKRYCSLYVQLSRVKSLQGLYLLQPVSSSDLNGKPDKLLVQEDDRIAQLARSTEIASGQIEATDDFRYGRANRM